MKKNMQGFTLIELMIVIAIIAILVAIALPAYRDYTVRTKNSECLSVASAAKLGVAEAIDNGIAVASIDTAASGFVMPTGGTKYCASVTVAAGTITATTQATGATSLAAFNLVPDLDGNAIDWACNYSGGDRVAQIPAQCRSAAPAPAP